MLRYRDKINSSNIAQIASFLYYKHLKNGHITKLNNLPAIQDTRTAEYSKESITLTCMESKGLSKSSWGI